LQAWKRKRIDVSTDEMDDAQTAVAVVSEDEHVVTALHK
jgi:hypothetical protein